MWERVEIIQGFLVRALFVSEEELHWLREDLALSVGQTMNAMVRVRYRQVLQQAVLHQVNHGLFVVFQDRQSAVTPWAICCFLSRAVIDGFWGYFIS